jgi:hypothetical protein
MNKALYNQFIVLLTSRLLQTNTTQYGFPSGPGESSHIQDDAVEPAQT